MTDENALLAVKAVESEMFKKRIPWSQPNSVHALRDTQDENTTITAAERFTWPPHKCLRHVHLCLSIKQARLQNYQRACDRNAAKSKERVQVRAAVAPIKQLFELLLHNQGGSNQSSTGGHLASISHKPPWCDHTEALSSEGNASFCPPIGRNKHRSHLCRMQEVGRKSAILPACLGNRMTRSKTQMTLDTS